MRQVRETRRTFLHWASWTSLSAAMSSCEFTSVSLLNKMLRLPPDETSQTSSKVQAQNDYTSSLNRYGGRLSLPASQMTDRYDVLVIGSGYGGAICAAELAGKLRPGRSLALLERGKEWLPGQFPDTLSGVSNAMTGKDKLGLFDISMHRDVVVLAGSGLGGTSLINANVAIEPDEDIFRQGSWPSGFSKDALAPYFQKARRILNVRPTPADSLPKMRMLKHTASMLSEAGSYQDLDLAVSRGANDHPIINEQQMIQRRCTDCGDCMTGCNIGAKNTLCYNYLPLAKQRGAQLFCEGEVSHLEQSADGDYVVHYVHRSPPGGPWLPTLGAYVETHRQVRAKVIVVAAGTLGSTGIMLRSRQKGLPLSGRVGDHFSGNGDYLSLAENIQAPADFTIGGVGAYDSPANKPGPNIQSGTTYSQGGKSVLIEDLGFPRAVVPIVEALTSGVRRSMFYLAMGDDEAGGRIRLDAAGRPAIEWMDANRVPLFNRIKTLLGLQTSATSGKADARPRVVERLVGNRTVTAHPLGGCAMAENGRGGVVDNFGNAFTGDGTSCHSGLFVVDGAVIPAPLRCNPLLMISAIATRSAEHIAADPRFQNIFGS